MDQVFATRQGCKRCLLNVKDVLGAFVGLEKSFDTIGRYALWKMPRDV